MSWNDLMKRHGFTDKPSSSIYEYVIDRNTNFNYNSKNPDRICCVEGCGQLGQDVTSSKMKLKNISRRRNMCSNHYRKSVAVKHGVDNFTQVLAKNAGLTTSAYTRRTVENCAKNAGLTTTAYRRKNHSSRAKMLEYCENIDGRLGFKCTTTIILDCGMLHVDHKNGIPFDEDLSNYQTLCSCCHSYKSSVFKDYASIGRKAAKQIPEEEKRRIIAEANIRYAEQFAKFTASNNAVTVVKSDNNIEEFISSSKKARKHYEKFIKHVSSHDDVTVKVIKW